MSDPSGRRGPRLLGPEPGAQLRLPAGLRARLVLRRLRGGARALRARVPGCALHRRAGRPARRPRARRRRARHARPHARRARRAGAARRQALLRGEAAGAVGRGRRARRRRGGAERPRADGRPPARVPPGGGQAQGDRRLGRARRHPLHLLQPPQPRAAADGRECPVVARGARRLGHPAPGRRGALRARRAGRVLHPAGDRGRRVRLPALPLRPRRAPAPLLARPPQGAAFHGRRLEADGDVRRHGHRAQGDGLRQGLRRGLAAPTASTSPARGTSGARGSPTASRCGSSASTSSSASARGARPLSDGASGLRVVRVLEGLQARLDASRREQGAAI